MKNVKLAVLFKRNKIQLSVNTFVKEHTAYMIHVNDVICFDYYFLSLSVSKKGVDVMSHSLSCSSKCEKFVKRTNHFLFVYNTLENIQIIKMKTLTVCLKTQLLIFNNTA